MMCEPSEADLAHCVQRGIAAARQAGENQPDHLKAWAQREILAAWPHIGSRAVQAAIARHLAAD
ncbi:MAG: hypothetical protein QF384_02145 [Alphaproteobacteria bacterium]|jgi:hypothetical protein|nr:hypothetical protein [Alphaproteobacteria bacterium]MDP6830119.1 hypothetical protein [Alphaproteobacteria bacterium]MDP6872480.1 hypothetical protein [Alphaproteobacteria bacterium]